jgi:hypothetical protein
MLFNPSPALHKIRQLVRLIRRDAVPSRPCRNTPLHGQELPDPAHFIDSSVPTGADGSGQTRSQPRRKRANCPSRSGR